MFILFLIVSILVYGLLVFYVGWSIYKGFHLHKLKWMKYVYFLVIGFISITFIIARYSEGYIILELIGNYWLALFCILLLTLPFVHLIMLLLRFTKWDKSRVKYGATIVMTVVTIIGFSIGLYNAYTTKITSYNISINKEGPEQLKAVLLTDTHFGYLSGIRHAERMVENVNALNADYIFFSGDIIDDDLTIVREKGIFEELAKLEGKYGTYAVLGNHDKDDLGKIEIIQSLEQANMIVLYDEVILNDEGIVIAGRKDLSENERLTANQLLANVDKSKPIIVLDHQPADLIALSEEGADLTLSGHTHHGQIFPGNLFTERLFPNDYGLKIFNEMSSVVSSGYGFWGPPIRIGSQSEIMLLNLQFK